MEFNPTTVSEFASKLGLNPEVFTKSLLKDTPEAEVAPIITSLKGLEVFSNADFTARIARERTEAATEAARTATGNAYGAQDKRILADTGVAKNEGESTIDYMARAAKEKYGTKTEESAEMKRLRDTIEAKDGLLNQATTKLQEMEVAHTTERKQTQINATLDVPIKKLTINVPIDPKAKPEDYAAALASQQEYVKWRFTEAYTADVVDGKVQFTDKATGKVVTDPLRAGNPMEADILIAQFAPKVVSLKAPSTAQGSGFDASRTNLNGSQSNIDFSVYTSGEAFTADLKKQGIPPGGKEGGKLYAKFMEARPDLFPKT